MDGQEPLELRIKKVIVEALMMEEVKPEEIETDAPLFIEGLGLDSIDALELAIALNKEFGLKTKAGDEKNREIFYSVASLAEAIRSAQAEDSSTATSTPAPSEPPPEA